MVGVNPIWEVAMLGNEVEMVMVCVFRAKYASTRGINRFNRLFAQAW